MDEEQQFKKRYKSRLKDNRLKKIGRSASDLLIFDYIPSKQKLKIIILKSKVFCSKGNQEKDQQLEDVETELQETIEQRKV